MLVISCPVYFKALLSSTSQIKPQFVFLFKVSLIWSRPVCHNEWLNQSCSLQSPIITCRCTTTSALRSALDSCLLCLFCPLPCLSDLLRALQQQRQQCSLSRRLVGNLGRPAHSDSQVSHESMSSTRNSEVNELSVC